MEQNASATLYEELTCAKDFPLRVLRLGEQAEASVKISTPNPPRVVFEIVNYDQGQIELDIIRRYQTWNRVVQDAVHGRRSIEDTLREVSEIYGSGFKRICKWIEKDEHHNALCQHLSRTVQFESDNYLTRGFFAHDNLSSAAIIFTPLAFLLGGITYAANSGGTDSKPLRDAILYLGAMPLGIMAIVQASVLSSLRKYRKGPVREGSDELQQARELDEIINRHSPVLLGQSCLPVPVASVDAGSENNTVVQE